VSNKEGSIAYDTQEAIWYNTYFTMPRPEQKDDIPEYGKRSFTPNDLFHWYLIEHHPVGYEALRALVEPLAGTSFGRIALDALHTEFDAQPLAPPPPTIMPEDLYLAFFKHIDDTNIDNDLKGMDALNAETALWSHLTHNVAVHSIYPDERLEPSEMAFHQLRHDDVWYDPEHTHLAFIHGHHQWQFFRNGERVGGLSLQSVHWQDHKNSSLLHLFHVLAEGSPHGRQFFDERMQAIIALPRELQTFKRYTNLLFVSERFDFHAALKASKPPGTHIRR